MSLSIDHESIFLHPLAECHEFWPRLCRCYESFDKIQTCGLKPDSRVCPPTATSDCCVFILMLSNECSMVSCPSKPPHTTALCVHSTLSKNYTEKS